MPDETVRRELFGEQAEGFLRDHWPDKPFHHRGDPGRFAFHREAPHLRSVQALLSWAESAGFGAFFADLPSVRDEMESFEGLDAGRARWALGAGMTVRANFITAIPAIMAFVRQMRVALGLRRFARARNVTYCSPPGEGTSLHFDADINVIAQVAGEKRWLLAPNFEVENPTERYSTKMECVPGRLRPCAPALPRELPARSRAEALEIQMLPGDVLFVPRGFWHSTSCVTESLQVNFTADSPTWGQVLTLALSRRLEQDAAFRGLACDLDSDDAERRAAAVERLGALLGDAHRVLSSLDPAELITDATWWHANR